MELINFAKYDQFYQVKEVRNIILNNNNIDLNKKNIINVIINFFYLIISWNFFNFLILLN